MLDITNSLLAMTALFNVGLAFFILRKNWKEPVNFYFGMYLLSLSSWALLLIGYQTAMSSETAILYGKAAYAAALLIGLGFYLFSIVFPEGKRPRTVILLIMCGVPLLYILALFQPTFFIENIIIQDWGKEVHEGVMGYVIFALIFCFLYIGGLVRIYGKYLSAKGTTRTQLLVIGLSGAITGIGGAYYNLVLASPFFENFKYLWSGPIFATSISVMIMYSVFRLHLFNVKVIVTELLIYLLWIFTFLRTLLAINSNEKVLNGILFVLALIIGALLIKSVRTEIENRERTESLALTLEKANAKLKERTVQLEKSEKEELAKAQEVARLKDEFVFLAVHELRTPVTAIRGFLELVEDAQKNFPRDIKEKLQAISQASEHLNQLVNDILEIARSENNSVVMNLAPQEFKPILDGVLHELSSLVEQKGITIVLDMKPLSPVLCDPAKTKEILSNLVGNAIKYNREKGSIFISVYEAQGSKDMLFEIRDTGYGIPKDQQNKIFQKFFRAVTHETQETLGTGLGLFITRMLVEKMGGQLMFSSVEHEGATFSFTLPLVLKT